MNKFNNNNNNNNNNKKDFVFEKKENKYHMSFEIYSKNDNYENIKNVIQMLFEINKDIVDFHAFECNKNNGIMYFFIKMKHLFKDFGQKQKYLSFYIIANTNEINTNETNKLIKIRTNVNQINKIINIGCLNDAELINLNVDIDYSIIEMKNKNEIENGNGNGNENENENENKKYKHIFKAVADLGNFNDLVDKLIILIITKIFKRSKQFIEEM